MSDAKVATGGTTGEAATQQTVPAPVPGSIEATREVAGPAPNASSDHLMELIAALESRIAALEARPTPNLNALTDTLTSRVNDLADTLDAIKSHLPVLAQMRDHMPLLNRVAQQMGLGKPKGAGKISN